MSVNSVTGWDVLDGAHGLLRSAVLAVTPQDLDRRTPCDDWSVIQVIQHAAGDQVAWAAAVGGGPTPTENPFTPSGKLPDAPPVVVDEALRRASAAWAAVGEDAGPVETPLPQGQLPAALAAGACALDAAIHASDIAVATGQPGPLRSALAGPLRAAAAEIVEPLRGFAYAPPLAAQAGDDEVTALLRYLGRRPDWPATS
jgi:uncharacterized protein (TIGR03086 family)